ncbi:MAG: hypothetical protein IPH16_19310 [Haliscomenobacter sp.]|nr:hypothetical protein [Haliscomenobacter sp.]
MVSFAPSMRCTGKVSPPASGRGVIGDPVAHQHRQTLPAGDGANLGSPGVARPEGGPFFAPLDHQFGGALVIARRADPPDGSEARPKRGAGIGKSHQGFAPALLRRLVFQQVVFIGAALRAQQGAVAQESAVAEIAELKQRPVVGRGIFERETRLKTPRFRGAKKRLPRLQHHRHVIGQQRVFVFPFIGVPTPLALQANLVQRRLGGELHPGKYKPPIRADDGRIGNHPAVIHGDLPQLPRLEQVYHPLPPPGQSHHARRRTERRLATGSSKNQQAANAPKQRVSQAHTF